MAKKTKAMTATHKAALAEGREQSRAVRNYLEALDDARSAGRRPSRDALEAKLARIEDGLVGADAITRLGLLQQRRDVRSELESVTNEVDLEARESAFVAAAKGYSERKGITYATWREAGVPAAVLRAAGINRRL